MFIIRNSNNAEESAKNQILPEIPTLYIFVCIYYQTHSNFYLDYCMNIHSILQPVVLLLVIPYGMMMI